MTRMPLEKFFGPFYGAYIIVELDKADYNYALVVGGNTKYLWILARTPRLDEDRYQRVAGKGTPYMTYSET